MALFSPVTNFSTTLAQSMTSSQLSMVLSSVTIQGHALVAADYGSVLYFTINPGAANMEVVKCTTNSGTTFTIDAAGRGLAWYGETETQPTGYAFDHNAGETVIISNSKEVYNQIVDKFTDETIAGVKTFSSYPKIASYVAPTVDEQFAPKKYADDLAIAGAPDASTTVKGIVEEATQAEIDAGTGAGGTGARLAVNPSTLATSIYNTQLPSSDQKAALAGTSGSPSVTNKFVTNDDTSVASAASKVVRSNASSKVAISYLYPATVTDYSAGATWTKPTGATVVKVICVGAGGGGGGGNRTSSVNAEGGGGGGGGAASVAVFDASVLGATETITVGTGGTGGPGSSGASATNGGNGGESSFGTWLKAGGGGGGLGGTTSGGVAGGAGGSAVNSGSTNTAGAPSAGGANAIGGQGSNGAAAGGTGWCAEYGGGAGAGSSTGTGVAGGSSIYAGAGGGSGAGGTTNPTAGGNGGSVQSYAAGGGGAGGTNGATPGTAGSVNSVIKKGYGGSGGGGGGLTGGGSPAFSAGGNGGAPGGGGGGGAGGNFATGTGGTGGNGAVGLVRVIVFF